MNQRPFQSLFLCFFLGLLIDSLDLEIFDSSLLTLSNTPTKQQEKIKMLPVTLLILLFLSIITPSYTFQRNLQFGAITFSLTFDTEATVDVKILNDTQTTVTHTHTHARSLH